MSKTFKRFGLAALLIGAMVSAANADFSFDLARLGFTYTRTNATATAGQVIGTITVTTVAKSTASAIDMATGDGAQITPGTAFNFSFNANVIKGAGANNYSIVSDTTTGGALLSDTTLTTKVAAAFTSTGVGIIPGNAFFFGGPIGDLGLNDSILVGGVGDSWTYAGNQPLPFVPSVGLATGRSLFDYGTLTEFQAENMGSISSLDSFFTDAATRTSDLCDVKITVVPAPGAIILGVIGLGAVAGLRRRFAR